jgi:DnaK suppressor protein
MTGIVERPRIAPSATARGVRALSSRQLSGIRKHLLSDREQTRLLVEQLDREMDDFVSARNDAPTDDEHDPEGPTLAFERSQASAVRGQSRRHLSDIDSALQRMDDGAYGLCTMCGGPIALGRLEVRPQAAHCIDCASRL